MARFVIMTYGSSGDVFPFIWTGRLLKEEGHEVVVIASAYFEEAIRGAGLDCIPLGTKEHFLQLANDPDLWSPVRSGPLLFAHCARVFPQYCAAAESLHLTPQDVVMGSAVTFAARAMHEKYGCRHVTLHLQPVILLSFREFSEPGPAFHWMKWLPAPWLRWIFESDSNPMNRLLTPAIRQWCEAENLPAPRRIFPDWWHSPEHSVAYFPEWFAGNPPDWPRPLLFAGFPLYDLADQCEPDPALEAFLEAGPPPLLVTAGSAMMHASPFFHVTLKVCQQLGVRAIFVAKYDRQVPDPLPPDFYHSRFVPFSRILPRCRLFINHGGVGTVSQGLAFGLPQIVVAMAHDQPDNGARIKKLGAGEWIMSGDWNEPNARRLIEKVQGNPSYRTVAAKCAEKIRQHDAAECVREMMKGLATAEAGA
ncbi:MAG: glycosyltransferase [Verrucomicrobiae bacterium]|nr:glycosyltransferase [Verrucomicrobiae bacterium]